MAQQRAWTATFDKVSSIADRALRTERGLTIPFRVEKLGSPDACRQAARSFQKSFTALRARARRITEINKMERGKRASPTVSEAHGIYDKLVCELKPLADGSWEVLLAPWRVVLEEMEVIDNDTGELADDIAGNMSERMKLIQKSIHERKSFTWMDWDRLSALDEEFRAQHKGEEGFHDFPWHTTPQGEVWYPRPDGDATFTPQRVTLTNDYRSDEVIASEEEWNALRGNVFATSLEDLDND